MDRFEGDHPLDVVAELPRQRPHVAVGAELEPPDRPAEVRGLAELIEVALKRRVHSAEGRGELADNDVEGPRERVDAGHVALRPLHVENHVGARLADRLDVLGLDSERNKHVRVFLGVGQRDPRVREDLLNLGTLDAHAVKFGVAPQVLFGRRQRRISARATRLCDLDVVGDPKRPACGHAASFGLECLVRLFDESRQGAPWSAFFRAAGVRHASDEF
mmetsp:Transcript_23705/g.69788  ORF Transcript_23705/g.69788 Transcript_23705/m.69788 type:complete len:218 (+) Transcript_23705:883-1536(+)